MAKTNLLSRVGVCLVFLFKLVWSYLEFLFVIVSKETKIGIPKVVQALYVVAFVLSAINLE